jgi:hypothetical protein
MNRRLNAWVLLLLAGLLGFGLLGCEDDDDDNNNLGNNDAVVGIWRHTVANMEEETVELTADGVINWVIADLQNDICISSEGTWEADSDSITTTDDLGSSTVAFTVSGNSLVITAEDGEELTYTRISTMVDCDDYGFASGGMSATIDGTARNLDNFTMAAVDSDTGMLMIMGSDLSRQIVLSLEAATPGTYNLSSGDNSATYVPSTLNPSDFYLAMIGMGSGSVVITSNSGNVVSGTFTYVAQHISSMATVSVTSGSFSVPYTVE